MQRAAGRWIAAWAVGLVLAWTAPSWSAEDPAAASSSNSSTPAAATAAPASSHSAADDADAALQHALELERSRNWTAAITAYEQALEQWPARVEFRHRLRLCEIHYRLGRRYHDHSFRTVLLRLPQDKALDLYDEVVERIQTHYVDPVALEPLLRHGFDNLEVALRDPAFLQTNAPSAPAANVKWLRDQFRLLRDRVFARDRDEARVQVVSACERAAQGLGIAATPIVLEFVFGACDALDDYSSYLTPDKLDDLYAMIDGNFVGLGVELKLDDLGLRIVNVIKNGPAWQAGLKAGDRITHVADQPVKGLGLDEAASRLQGSADTSVAITVLRANGQSKRFVLVRKEVEVDSVAQAKIVEPTSGIGYIQLIGFQKTSTEELDRAIAMLQQKGMRFLILDLRGNPGGLLNVAVEMADRFIEQGVIVSTRGRAAGQSYVYRARSNNAWRMPMAVLIDHDSASASEILAGALKDHNRALIVGERTYGKGSVQSIFSLRSAPAGLKLTTAKFYSPTNRPYSEQGVEPDLKVRVALKPSGSESSDAPFDFGDPSADQALVAAIQQARRQLTTFR